MNELDALGIAGKLHQLGMQMSALAQELAGQSGSGAAALGSELGVFSFSQNSASGRDDSFEQMLTNFERVTRPALPDPRLVRRIIRHRQLRARYLSGELFADPAWDMLLDLLAARAEHARVSVTSLCIASGVPPTTALRWIAQMTEMGLLIRTDDDTDRRRAFITLTDKAADALARYFAEIRHSAMLV